MYAFKNEIRGVKMLFDLHAHSSGISTCCKADAPQILETAKQKGIDGVVLTNHYHKDYIRVTGETVLHFVDRYIEEYHYAREWGESIGVKVFYGIEVTMEYNIYVHMLVYGVDTDFLKRHSNLWDLSQKELYQTVKEEGGVLVQAHPFRNGTTVADTRYLDGVEINCHPKYNNSYAAELEEIAKENNLIVTCGGDYHNDDYRPECGMYLPDSIRDGIELGEYLKKINQTQLCIHEPHTEEPYIKTFEVSKK